MTFIEIAPFHNQIMPEIRQEVGKLFFTLSFSITSAHPGRVPFSLPLPSCHLFRTMVIKTAKVQWFAIPLPIPWGYSVWD